MRSETHLCRVMASTTSFVIVLIIEMRSFPAFLINSISTSWSLKYLLNVSYRLVLCVEVGSVKCSRESISVLKSSACLI